MNMSEEVTSDNFSTLPEDIKVRILRRAGVGVLTKQHRDLITEDRIKDAGTKPFIKSEIEYLMEVRRSMGIIYENDGYSISYIIVPLLNKSRNLYIQTQRLSSKVLSGSGRYTENIMVKYDDTNDEYSKNVIIYQLINRFDSKITKHAGFIVNGLEGGIEVGIEVEANIVLTDIRSIFIVLRERFMNVASDTAINLARKYTKKAFNNIVNDMQHKKIFALLIYCITNAILLDLNVDLHKYMSPYIWESTDTKDITERCNVLHSILTDVINNMI